MEVEKKQDPSSYRFTVSTEFKPYPDWYLVSFGARLVYASDIVISLDDTKGVVNYSELVSQERKKRHQEAMENSATSSSTTPSAPPTDAPLTPPTPPLNTSIDESNASLDTTDGSVLDGSMEGVIDLESGDEKKSSKEKVSKAPVMPKKKKPTNRLVQIIDKIEKMYTYGGDSFMIGYDTSDSFIDDSDMVEKQTEEVENDYGGFFVHAGELKSRKKKRVSDFEEDSPEKHKAKRVSKKPKTDDDKQSSPNKEKSKKEENGKHKEKEKKDKEKGKKDKEKGKEKDKNKEKGKENKPKEKKDKEGKEKGEKKLKEEGAKEKEKEKEKEKDKKAKDEELVSKASHHADESKEKSTAGRPPKSQQIDEKVELAIKELEVEAKKKIPEGAKRIPPELAPQLSQVYEALQQTSNGNVTDMLLTRLTEFLPFAKSTIKSHLKKSKHKSIVDTMEQELKHLEDIFDAEYNKLRAAVFQAMEDEKKKPPTPAPAEGSASDSSNEKKYPWNLVQRNLLYETLLAGYSVVEFKIQIAQEKAANNEGEVVIPSMKHERAQVLQRVLEIFPVSLVTGEELTKIYNVRQQARRKKEKMEQEKAAAAANSSTDSNTSASPSSSPTPSPAPSPSPSPSISAPLMPPPPTPSVTSPFFPPGDKPNKVKSDKKLVPTATNGNGAPKPKVSRRKTTPVTTPSASPTASPSSTPLASPVPLASSPASSPAPSPVRSTEMLPPASQILQSSLPSPQAHFPPTQKLHSPVQQIPHTPLTPLPPMTLPNSSPRTSLPPAPMFPSTPTHQTTLNTPFHTPSAGQLPSIFLPPVAQLKTLGQQ